MARPEVRTQFATQATALSTHFGNIFGKVTVPKGFAPALTAPAGPSTGGGKQSMQHVTLTAGNVSVVVGHLDTREMKAVIRSYAYLVQQRRGQPFGLDENAYLQFSERVKEFCEKLNFEVTFEEAPEASEQITEPVAPTRAPARAEAPTSSGGGSFWAGFVIGGILLGAASAVGVYLLMRPH